MGNAPAAASFNIFNDQVQYMPRMSNQGIVRIQVPSGNIQNVATNQGTVRIRLPVAYTQTLQNGQGMVRIQLPAANAQPQPGSSSNVVDNFRSSAPSVPSAPGNSISFATMY